ncbi:MAG: TIGR02449 family protein [Granulosicoccus sp.]
MSRPTFNEELSTLESRLQALLALCTRLRVENRSLKGQQTTLVEERARLIEKNETARTKVEQMIIRLKSMEAGQ